MRDEKVLRAMAAVAKEVGVSQNGKSAFSQLIVETIQPNRLTLDFFSAFMPTRQLNIGDSLVKRTRNIGMPVRTMVPGVNHLADQLGPPSETYTFGIDSVIAKIRYSLWELQRAELYSLDDLRSEMQSALTDDLVARIFTLIGSTWSSTNNSSNYATVSTAVTETVLENMIEQVLTYAGSVKAIVGTRKALLPIYKFAGLVEHVKLADGTTDSNPNLIPIMSILEEWRRSGRVASFRGTPLIELPQLYKRTTNAYDEKLIDETQIQVIGDDAGEIVLYGGTNVQDSQDLTTEPPTYTLAMWRSFGMIIDEPRNIGIIKIV